MNYNFPIIYWANRATKVQFEPFESIANNSLVIACMVCVVQDNLILLSQPKRGWGLPGGHVEPHELPEECAIREVKEETNVEISDLKLVGGWKAQKIRYNEQNSKYLDVSYQLLFLAKPTKIDEFVPNEEIFGRMFIKFADLKKYHHDFDNFSEILKYIINEEI